MENKLKISYTLYPQITLFVDVLFSLIVTILYSTLENPNILGVLLSQSILLDIFYVNKQIETW